MSELRNPVIICAPACLSTISCVDCVFYILILYIRSGNLNNYRSKRQRMKRGIPYDFSRQRYPRICEKQRIDP